MLRGADNNFVRQWCVCLHCFVGEMGLFVKGWEVGAAGQPSLALHTVDHGVRSRAVMPQTGTPAARTKSGCKGDASNACARCRWVMATMVIVVDVVDVVFAAAVSNYHSRVYFLKFAMEPHASAAGGG